MFQFFNRLSIFQRLLVAFCLAAIIPAVIILIFCSSYISVLSSYDGAKKSSNELLHVTRRLQNNLASTQNLASDYVAERSYISQERRQSYRNKLSDLKKATDADMALLKNGYNVESGTAMAPVRNLLQASSTEIFNTLQEEQSDYLNYINNKTSNLTQWENYYQDINRLLDSSTKDVSYIQADINKSYTSLVPNVQRLTQNALQVQEHVENYSVHSVNQLTLWIALAIVAFMIFIFMLGYSISRAVIEPFQQLEIWTRRIAKGDMNVRAPRMGLDEIDTVAQSMNDMLDRTMYLMAETQKQHEVLQGQIEQLVNEVNVIGDGDLRARATVTPDTIGVLSQSFNYMIEELSNLIVHVKNVALEVDGLKNVVLERMMRLVSTNSVQMNRMGMAAVEVERMAQLSRLVAERAQTLNHMSSTARVSAQSGRKAMKGVIEGMERISHNVSGTVEHVSQLNQRSIEIANAVKVIASIVHQTNKLALDASIQAAMAGREGQGFGAVAADIRRLAERAAERAQTVTVTAQRIQEDMSVASQSVLAMDQEAKRDLPLTHNAGTALESIFAAIEKEASEIEHISAMTTQQLKSASTIVSIFNAMAQVTRQNNATMQQMSVETRKLAPQVEQLRTSVEAFNLREDIVSANTAMQMASATSSPNNYTPVPVAQFSPVQQPMRGPLFRRPVSGNLPNTNKTPEWQS